MSELVDPFSFVEDIKPERFSEATLLKELREFANRNPRFKAGQMNHLSVKLAEYEAFTAEFTTEMLEMAKAEECPDDQDDILYPFLGGLGLRYEFAVDRIPQSFGRPIFDYGLTVIAQVEKVGLPEPLSYEIFGKALPREEIEIQLGQDVGLARTLRFEISTASRELTSCDAYRFFGLTDSTEIQSACTCKLPENTLKVFADHTDEADGSLLEVPGEIALYDQPYPIGVLEPREFEAIRTQTPDDALEDWIKWKKFEGGFFKISQDQYDHNLRLGVGALRGLKRAISQMAS